MYYHKKPLRRCRLYDELFKSNKPASSIEQNAVLIVQLLLVCVLTIVSKSQQTRSYTSAELRTKLNEELTLFGNQPV